MKSSKLNNGPEKYSKPMEKNKYKFLSKEVNTKKVSKQILYVKGQSQEIFYSGFFTKELILVLLEMSLGHFGFY